MNMRTHEKAIMQWIMFIVFLALFTLITIGTGHALFFGGTELSQDERDFLMKTFFGEISAVVIALFYSLFGLTKSSKNTDKQPANIDAQPSLEKHPFCNSSLYSIIYNPKYIDDKHEYDYVYRQDLIDYKTQEYQSIRELKGRNASETDSMFLWYSESTEIPTRFNDIKIVAKDLLSKEELLVEYDGDTNNSEIIHPFKIYFQRPLEPGHSFHIGYYMHIFEANKAVAQRGTMSMSLSRMKTVKHLQFNVCVNFKPKVYQVEVLEANKGKYNLNDSECHLEEYNPKTDLEKEYNLNWSGTPYVIRSRITSHPFLVAINYQQ